MITTTPQDSTVRLHLGCGNVYLQGWINVDVHQPGFAFTPAERPDLVEALQTTLSNYYKYPFGQAPNAVLADRFMDITALEFPDGFADEILAVGVFEHFSRDEARRMLADWCRVLKPTGRAVIDVPDLVATGRLLTDATTPEEALWAIRLIYGSQKNPFSFHKWGYTPDTLAEMARQCGFSRSEPLTLVEHDYPMFSMALIR
jgi:predicted SAM-dependent methyltransferase